MWTINIVKGNHDKYAGKFKIPVKVLKWFSVYDYTMKCVSLTKLVYLYRRKLNLNVEDFKNFGDLISINWDQIDVYTEANSWSSLRLFFYLQCE